MTADGKASVHSPEYYRRLRNYEVDDAWTRAMGDWTLELIRRWGQQGGRPRILDAGCAAAGFLPRCREELGARTWGIDLTRYALELARDDGERNIAEASVVEQPFGDRTFEAVISHNVLQHLTMDQAQASAREAARLLVPGGVFVVRAAARRGLLWKKHVDAEDYLQWEPGRVRPILEQAGLRVRFLSLVNAAPSLLADVVAFLTQPRPEGDVGLGEPPKDAEWKAALLSRYWGIERRMILAGLPCPFGHSVIAAAVKEA